MTLTFVIIILAFFAACGFVFYRIGRRLSDLESIEVTVKNISDINKHNRVEDEETERQVHSAGDNPVRGPWLR